MQNSNWGDKFSHVAMKDLARFLTTYNMVDQTVAVDGSNVYNIQTTGGGDCTINGVYIPALAADAELLIITDQAFPTSAWAVNTAYSVDDEVYTGTAAGITGMAWKCIKAHTSDDMRTPAGNLNPQLWQAIPNLDTLSIGDDETLWCMITAEADGTLGMWIASTELGTGAAAPTNGLVIPYFDPAVYCVLAFGYILNVTNSATGVLGAAGTGAGYIELTAAADITYHVVLGPVFPHPNNMPKN